MSEAVAVGRGRAPSKVILAGEHACVYGHAALAAPLARSVRVTATPSENASLVGPGGVRDEEPVREALAAIFEAAQTGPHRIDLESEVPLGVGLGSSASIAVAIARAILGAGDGDTHRDRIAAVANAWERVFHANPSGIDVACVVRGVPILFRRGGIAHGEPSSVSSSVEVVAPGGSIPLCVAFSGAPSSTRAMVEAVRRLRERERPRVDAAFSEIERIVLASAAAVRAADLAALGALFDDNHDLLCELELSTDSVERVRTLARAAGALGAKVTGAGGGGAVIALAPSHEAARHIASELEARGVSGFATAIGADAHG